MRETKIQKIARLQRQKDEWMAKYKNEHRIVRQLSSALKKQSADTTIIDKYKEMVSALNETNNSLRDNVSNLESQIKKLESNNYSIRKELDAVRQQNYDLTQSIEKEKKPKRLEDFVNGRIEDRWGMPFFDNNLIPQFNPYNGEVIYYPTQIKIMNVLDTEYKVIWDDKRNLLNEYSIQNDNCDISMTTFKERRHQLGLELWNTISENQSILEILKREF